MMSHVLGGPAELVPLAVERTKSTWTSSRLFEQVLPRLGEKPRIGGGVAGAELRLPTTSRKPATSLRPANDLVLQSRRGRPWRRRAVPDPRPGRDRRWRGDAGRGRRRDWRREPAAAIAGRRRCTAEESVGLPSASRPWSWSHGTGEVRPGRGVSDRGAAAQTRRATSDVEAGITDPLPAGDSPKDTGTGSGDFKSGELPWPPCDLGEGTTSPFAEIIHPQLSLIVTAPGTRQAARKWCQFYFCPQPLDCSPSRVCEK